MILYILMALLTILALCTAIFLRKQHESTKRIGMIAWIALSVYFILEYIVIRATIVPYNILKQPMSDLGVTSCGVQTYELALYEICSPYHLLMNWTFTMTGIITFVGAIFLHQFWPNKRGTRIATVLLVIFGLSYGVSGVFPADLNFLIHTFASLPGMFVQIPALILIGLAIRKPMPKLSKWTFFSVFLTTGSLILIFLQPMFTVLPGGLLQRILYGSVWLWMIVTAIVLWKNNEVSR